LCAFLHKNMSFFRFFFNFSSFCSFFRLFVLFFVFLFFFLRFFPPLFPKIERGFSFNCKACSRGRAESYCSTLSIDRRLRNAAVGRKDRSNESIAQVCTGKMRFFLKFFYFFTHKHLQILISFKSHKFSTEMRKFIQLWGACFSSPPEKKYNVIGLNNIY